MYSKTILFGYLGKDPELKTTSGGREYLTFSLATTKSYRDDSGDLKETTEWHKCVIWGKLAGKVKMKKGDAVFIEGENKTRSWKEDNGKTSYMTEVSVSRILNSFSKIKVDQTSGNSGYSPDDDDIPF